MDKIDRIKKLTRAYIDAQGAYVALCQQDTEAWRSVCEETPEEGFTQAHNDELYRIALDISAMRQIAYQATMAAWEALKAESFDETAKARAALEYFGVCTEFEDTEAEAEADYGDEEYAPNLASIKASGDY